MSIKIKFLFRSVSCQQKRPPLSASGGLRPSKSPKGVLEVAKSFEKIVFPGRFATGNKKLFHILRENRLSQQHQVGVRQEVGAAIAHQNVVKALLLYEFRYRLTVVTQIDQHHFSIAFCKKAA